MATMTREQFQDLLDRHGAWPHGWPSALRRKAEAALAEDGDLRAMLAAEQALADALSNPPPVSASAVLRRIVMDIPIDHPRPASRPGVWRGMAMAWRRWTAGMATATAAGLLGFFLGYGQLVTLPSAAAGEQVVNDDLLSLLDQTAEIDTAELESTQ